MATFVVTHGACGGGWEWAEVAAMLRAGGHDVHTPTFTGLGDRAHLLTREVDLSLHVHDVLEMLVRQDVVGAILVGHSYSGMVLPMVADRVRRLVVIDGFLPGDGESARELTPADIWDEVIARPAATDGDGWWIPPWGFGPEDLPGVTDERRAWYAERLAPHPVATLTEPARLPNGFPAQPGTYVSCGHGASRVMASSRERARALGWGMRTIDAAHDVQVTDPTLIARVLDEVATDG